MGSMHAVLGEKSVGEAMDVQDSTGLVAGRLGLVFAYVWQPFWIAILTIAYWSGHVHIGDKCQEPMSLPINAAF